MQNNTQKLNFYTVNEQTKKKVKKTTFFTKAHKKVNYLGINLTKEVHWNYKTLKEDKNKWKHKPCSCIKRQYCVKMLILTKVICRFYAILIKIPMNFFVEIDKSTLKCLWNFN